MWIPVSITSQEREGMLASEVGKSTVKFSTVPIVGFYPEFLDRATRFE